MKTPNLFPEITARIEALENDFAAPGYKKLGIIVRRILINVRFEVTVGRLENADSALYGAINMLDALPDNANRRDAFAAFAEVRNAIFEPIQAQKRAS